MILIPLEVRCASNASADAAKGGVLPLTGWNYWWGWLGQRIPTRPDAD